MENNPVAKALNKRIYKARKSAKLLMAAEPEHPLVETIGELMDVLAERSTKCEQVHRRAQRAESELQKLKGRVIALSVELIELTQ